MKIKRIEVPKWRNFEGIAIDLSDDHPLVCIVGANGTGKSHLLELISAAAHHLGLSAGIEIPRGNPFEDPGHHLVVEVNLSAGVSGLLDGAVNRQDEYKDWDRTIVVESRRTEHPHIFETRAGGIQDHQESIRLGQHIVGLLRGSQDVHHVSLDADRAYPRRKLQTHEMVQAFDTDWDNPSYRRSRSFHPTDTLYGEWIKYCLARENRAANLYYQGARRAAENGVAAPEFVDTFGTYRASLREVMPHLLFAGADQEKKSLLFDTSGMELRFDQLSGGEREIAFLIGQIDRFGLKHGLFLLDEPELHLNPDLVRLWVTYLAKTVDTGQVWLATHSLEAVEAAGQDATILLERNKHSKKVESAGRLTNRPAYSALSRAVGTPAFSMSELRFIFIEGEESIGERERYRQICKQIENTRFLECGSCNEVLRRLASVRQLATTVEQDIRVAGVIDRDWRSAARASRFAQENNLYVLPVHEVENFFLHPETIRGVAQQIGNNQFDYSESLRAACDRRAGRWIIQAALFNSEWTETLDLGAGGRALAHDMSWLQIKDDIEGAMRRVAVESVAASGLREKLIRRLCCYARVYARRRLAPDLRKICEGKEVLKQVCKDLGFSNSVAVERAAIKYWSTSDVFVPAEVSELRAYVGSV